MSLYWIDRGAGKARVFSDANTQELAKNELEKALDSLRGVDLVPSLDGGYSGTDRPLSFVMDRNLRGWQTLLVRASILQSDAEKYYAAGRRQNSVSVTQVEEKEKEKSVEEESPFESLFLGQDRKTELCEFVLDLLTAIDMTDKVNVKQTVGDAIRVRACHLFKCDEQQLQITLESRALFHFYQLFAKSKK